MRTLGWISSGALRVGVAAACALGLVACSWDPAAPPAAATLQTSDGASYLTNEVIVRVHPGMSVADLRAAVARVGGQVLDESGPMATLGYFRVALTSAMTADAAISSLVGADSVAR